jgi:hypothetical protein
MSIIIDNMDDRFWEYHRANPHVFILFARFAMQVKHNGHDHYSAKAIFERVRWHFSVETTGEDFKLNNNYTSRYARLLAEEYPEFEGFFRNRELSTYSNLENP